MVQRYLFIPVVVGILVVLSFWSRHLQPPAPSDAQEMRLTQSSPSLPIQSVSKEGRRQASVVFYPQPIDPWKMGLLRQPMSVSSDPLSINASSATEWESDLGELEIESVGIPGR
jgi:hypothetical protein